MINIEKKQNGKIKVTVNYFPNPICYDIRRENYEISFYKVQKLLRKYEYDTIGKNICRIIRETTKVIDDFFNKYEFYKINVNLENKENTENTHIYRKKNITSGSRAMYNLQKYFGK